ncbi:MAG: hypothetical protein PV340_03130 [Wolbachia sp.]|nr:hypothetical protein [Wolbachia sp.]MDD9336659.1 hypothetical protein [Wolbachia sp.]
MNIVLCDSKGNNVLHYIAPFTGRKKCIVLDRMLHLVKENKISKTNLEYRLVLKLVILQYLFKEL